MCSVLLSEQTANISLCHINLSIFITEVKCLLRRTDWVFKSDSYKFVLGLMSRVWLLTKHENKRESLIKYCCIDIVRP